MLEKKDRCGDSTAITIKKKELWRCYPCMIPFFWIECKSIIMLKE